MSRSLLGQMAVVSKYSSAATVRAARGSEQGGVDRPRTQRQGDEAT
jgi:hypothetical protein